MDIFNNLILGFSVALSFQNLMYCFLGVFVGTAIGVLPGIGPLVTIAMLLPITFNLAPIPALIMLAGIYYGSQYRGLHDLDPDESAGRDSLGRDLSRRLPDGASGAGRPRARHCRDRLVLRRLRGHAADRPVRSAARRNRAQVRRPGVFRADVDGLYRGRLPRPRRHGEIPRDGVPRPAVRHHRHRRELGDGALLLRPPGTDRRHRLHDRGSGSFRCFRNREEPRIGRGGEARGVHEGHQAPLSDQGGPEGYRHADPARHGGRRLLRCAARHGSGNLRVLCLHGGEEAVEKP